MLVPRKIIRPRVRFSSTASAVAAAEPGAGGAVEGLLVRRRVLRNSSVSARTRFMCWEEGVSIRYAGVRNGS